MTLALALLLALLSLCPAIVMVDGPIIPGLIPLLLAAGLFAVSAKLPPGEAKHLAAVVPRPLIVVGSLPAVAMLIQMMPLPFLANPVWTSVGAGFPHGITGSITVDTGATALALVEYLSAAGMALLAASVAINRERAELVLIGATGAAALISLAVLLHELFGSSLLAMRDEAFDCACLGVTLAAACGILVIERYETRQSKPGQTPRKFLFSLAACLTAFAICAGAVGAAKSGSLAFAAACGLLIFCAMFVIRRFALGRVGAAAIGVTAAIIAAALVTVVASDPDPRFAFVKKDPASIELTQRILGDAPFLGDGAGSYRALLPIYQATGSEPASSDAVTAAAKLSIEMGRTTLWLAILAAAYAVFVLVRGASRRGRDSFYAAAAGACLVTLMNLAFVNAGPAGPALSLFAAAIVGLGLAQSKSRVAS